MDDPYAPPTGPPARTRQAPSTRIGSAFGLIVASSVGFGLVGMLTGLGLGVALPDYYRGVFSEEVDPVQVGLGLGLSQGIGIGAVVGSVVIAGLLIGGARRRQIEQLRGDLDDLRAELARLSSRLDQR